MGSNAGKEANKFRRCGAILREKEKENRLSPEIGLRVNPNTREETEEVTHRGRKGTRE